MAPVPPRASALTLVKTDRNLENALNSFRSVLTDEQRKDLDSVKNVPDQQAVLIFTAELDAKRRTLKGRSIASRLYNILQCVRDFSSVVDTFVSSSPQIAALVWGSMRLTMMIAVNFLSYFEALTELFMNIQSVSPQFDQYQVLFPDSRGVQVALCDFHAAVIRCCQHIIIAIRRPWHEQLFNSLLQSLEQEFNPDMKEIDFQGKRVERELEFARTQVTLRSQQLQLNEQEESRTFRGAMRRITGQTSSRVKDLNQRLEKQRKREHRKQLLDTLSVHDHALPHRQNCKKRHSDTVQWCFKTPEYDRWFSGNSQVLWCSGKIGSGKTILASGMVDHVLTETRDPRDFVAFFFSKFDDNDSLKSETILGSLTRQVIGSASLDDDTLALLDTIKSQHALDLNILRKLINKSTTDGRKLYIIVDGVDECEVTERRELLNALASLIKLNSAIKLFIATRDTISNEIGRSFPASEHISMGCSSGQSDIATYVASTLETLIENEDLIVKDSKLIEEIKEALVKYSDGMFLWVAFQLQEICHKATDEEIRKTISRENIPKSLTEIFDRALNRIVSSGKEDVALKLLPWIAAAARPMTLDELEESVMIEIKQPFSMPERHLNGIHLLSSWFQGLVDVDEETKTASFAHGSIRHFFINGPGKDLERFSVDLDKADHYLGEICTTYLFFGDFQTALAKRIRPRPALQPIDLAWKTAGDSWGVLSDPTIRLKRRAKSISARTDVNKTLSSFARLNQDTALPSVHANHPFLAYAASYVFFHTKSFYESKSKTWKLFDRLLVHGHALVKAPWDSETKQEPDYLAIMEWACSAAHAPSIRFISNSDIPTREKSEMLHPDLEKFRGGTYAGTDPKGTAELVWHICCHGQEKALDAFFNSIDPNHIAAMLQLSLSVSILSRQAALVEYLLYKQIPKHLYLENWAGSEMGRATQIGDLEMVNVFLKYWREHGCKSRVIEFSLQNAIKQESIEVIEALLEAGCTLHESWMSEALTLALRLQHKQIVEILVNAGAQSSTTLQE